MPLFLNAIIVSFGMILLFFVFFLVIFLIAIALFPVERSISKILWDVTEPPPTPVKPKSTFKDFSTKH